MYDFNVNVPEEMDQKLQQLQIQCDKLSRNVNTRAINLLDKEEEQYNDMVKKKKIVESDKKKILETIKYLDEKKKETLLKAWEQVIIHYFSFLLNIYNIYRMLNTKYNIASETLQRCFVVPGK